MAMISSLSRTAVSMATILVASTVADEFPSDALWQQLFQSPAGPAEDLAPASDMAQMLIKNFDLKPIHIDDEMPKQSEDGTKAEKKQRHGKMVGNDIGGLGWDYALDQTNADNIGTSQNASIQMALAWAAPLYLDTVDRFTLLSMNPKFMFNIMGDFNFTVHLGFWEVTISVQMYPFKFTPFDILLRMDMMHPQRRCDGMDYDVKSLMAEIMIESKVNECYQGLLGTWTDSDPRDCTWRSYKPELPLYRFSLENAGNIRGKYWNYQCQNWYSAQWDNFPLTEEYISQHTQ